MDENVRCEKCGAPMQFQEHVDDLEDRLWEVWHCTNSDCGAERRILTAEVKDEG